MYEMNRGLPNAHPLSTKLFATNKGGSGGRRSGKQSELQSTDIYPNRRASSGGSASPSRVSASTRRGGSGSSAKKKRLRKRRIAVGIASVVIIGLIILSITVIMKSCSVPVEVDVATDVYRQGVTINGIDISGKTVDEARALITPGLDYTFANIAITLKTDDFAERITGEEMGATSDLEALLTSTLTGGANMSYYTKLSFDYQALDNRIAAINENLATGPTEASFSVTVSDSGKPEFTYTPGTPGYGLDITSTETMVRDALEKNDLQAILTPNLTTVEPTVTVDDIKAHTTLRSKFTTTYRAEGYDGMSEEEEEILANRSFNIVKGAELLNHLTVKVGETVSFNKVVGDRTEERGWKLANAIIFGNQYTLEAGGGICQVSTTLYGALLRGNIDITFRRHHSFPSDYVDKGLDATVDTGHIDFKFKNDTQYPLYIFAYVTKNRSSNRKRDITVAVYGEALPEGVTYEPRTELIEETPSGDPEIVYDKKKTVDYDVIEVSGRNGYLIDVYLDKLVDGKVESSEKLYQDEYKPVTERRRVGTVPLETPTPTPAPAVVTPAPNTENQP